MNDNNTSLLVGLGNPGIEYEKTRHNVGFILLDKYVDERNISWMNAAKFLGKIVKTQDYILLKPQTTMNKSGESVAKILNYHNVPLGNLIVVHDDVDLIFGEARVQYAASSAGHKGVQNIIDMLGSHNFWRIRIGIGRPENPNIEIENWVLTTFSDEEYDFINNIDLEAQLSLVR